ncbi:alpha-xenorhabdolysin family binary toxin subunit A [Pseudoalteromonas sp. Isolate6]|uniref:alpha-xenorhabdolysin family binary toxin subunit A n=1 Tax=Pseudoalteromonas sp. Isolate6 TaxID=2908527 RepID=UPI001EFDA6DE|nr:alpha-xenorhabdolysin family binary toxin subunit A [Pseudoalteromonas sp. Isolate6]MCG9761450.1 alpha-xenorhabdolysin family binary toxin subunit A [Pseudoalteromonas sp. Isolate6]
MKPIKLKKSAIAIVTSLQLFGLSQLATANTAVPEISPIMYDTLQGDIEGSPLFIDVGSDNFLLTQEQWHTIQVFAESAVSLPNTEAAFRSATRYPADTPLNNDYIALMTTFESINASGQNWNHKLYPSIIDLATKLANYSDTHVLLIQPFIDELTKLHNASLSGDLQAAEQSRQVAISFLNTFMNFVDGNLTKTQTVVDQLVTFQGDLTTHSGQLNTLEGTFEDILNKDQPANIRDRISTLQRRLNDLNDEKSDLKTGIGLSSLGGVLGLIIGGSIQGAQLEEVKSEINKVESQIETANKELAHAMSLAASYQIAKGQVEGMNEKIETALGNVRKVQVHWQSLYGDMQSLRDVLTQLNSDNALRNANVIVAGIVSSPLASNASNSWKDIADKARTFLQNAYLPTSQQ